MSETRKIAAILVADIVGYSRLAGADEDRTFVAAPGAAQRSDRSRHRRASWAHRQTHGRRQPHRIPQRGRRGALRHRSAEWPHRAQCGPAARAPHRVPRRHPFGRRRRGGRWRPDGRRRQHCRAIGRDRRARRDLSVRGRPSPGEGTARSRGQRPRPDPTQEHCRPCPGLFAPSRQAGAGEACGGGEAARAEKAFNAAHARARRSRPRSPSRSRRGHLRLASGFAPRLSAPPSPSSSRGTAPVAGRAALRQSFERSRARTISPTTSPTS